MRVYLDKQVMSYMFKKSNDKHVQLMDKLLNTKSFITFCYSHAHISDLKNDKSNIKFDELRFMQDIVENNYIVYDNSSKITTAKLAYPIEAFGDDDDETESYDLLSHFDSDDFEIDEHQKMLIEEIKKFLDLKIVDFSFVDLEAIPKEYLSAIEKVFPYTKEKLSLREFYRQGLTVSKNFHDDHSVYRTLRSYIDKSFNNGKFKIDYDEILFNNDFKNSEIKKTFIEFVKDGLPEKDPKKISNYDFFINAYLFLDMLGISKDKKVKFTNLMNDALHSYYGAHSDVIVSSDTGFLKKTRALYRLLGIKTETLSLIDFIDSYSFTIGVIENNIESFISLLMNDLKNGFVLKEKKSLRFDRTTTTIKTTHNYLGHFNRIDILVHEGQNFIDLYRESQNYSTFTFFTEIEKIVNIAISLFGIDHESKGGFEFDKEILEISNNTWKGRFWEYSNFNILLEINPGTERIGLTIGISNLL